jgi:hypothetical protein
LLYQDLIRAGQLSASGRLPPVLPLVLYNGAQVWNAAETLEPLIEPLPAVLADYRPRQAYLLLDEQRLAKAEQAPTRNLSAALFRLEASRGAAAPRRRWPSCARWSTGSRVRSKAAYAAPLPSGLDACSYPSAYRVFR